ncbi:MAG TPA: YdeI/OmpD-associated family protein [Opitutaceae bacterium]
MPTRPRDPRIDTYIAEAEPFARPILKHLRALVHEACPGVEETLKWSAPSFVYAGKILAGMASFKAHAAFGFWHPEMRSRVETKGAEAAMGSFGRITAISDLPGRATLLRLIKDAAKLNEGTEARPKGAAAKPRKPAKALAVPTDLAAALKGNAAAAKVFAAFPPSGRNEYVEWITEAKRPATRQQRLATTVQWLAEGKSRNWKYQG